MNFGRSSKNIVSSIDCIPASEPKGQHWFNVSVGRSGFHIESSLKASTDQAGCALYVEKPHE
jgi:hypothetical protein